MNPTTADLNTIASSPPAPLITEGFTFTQTLEEDTDRLDELRQIQGLPANIYPRVNISDGPYAGLYFGHSEAAAGPDRYVHAYFAVRFNDFIAAPRQAAHHLSLALEDVFFHLVLARPLVRRGLAEHRLRVGHVRVLEGELAHPTSRQRLDVAEYLVPRVDVAPGHDAGGADRKVARRGWRPGPLLNRRSCKSRPGGDRL